MAKWVYMFTEGNADMRTEEEAVAMIEDRKSVG